LKKHVRLPVSGNNPHLIGNSQFLQNLCRLCHNRHIRIASHYNTNLCHCSSSLIFAAAGGFHFRHGPRVRARFSPVFTAYSRKMSLRTSRPPSRFSFRRIFILCLSSGKIPAGSFLSEAGRGVKRRESFKIQCTKLFPVMQPQPDELRKNSVFPKRNPSVPFSSLCGIL